MHWEWRNKNHLCIPKTSDCFTANHGYQKLKNAFINSVIPSILQNAIGDKISADDEVIREPFNEKNTSQKWKLLDIKNNGQVAKNGYKQLVNEKENKCLSVWEERNTHHTRLKLEKCNSTDTKQQWEIMPSYN